MPAVGGTAKLPSPLDHAGLPLALDRHEPLPPPEHREPPSPLDLDRHQPLPPPDRHELPDPLDFDPVREGLCSVGPVAVAWAAQDAELDAEIAALEAAGVLTAPAEDEQSGPDLDPDSVPPLGLRPCLADLSGSPFDECPMATIGATGPEKPWTRRRNRAQDGGLGFAADGDADLLSPGTALAGLAEHARSAGLSRLTDDELAGMIRAGHRLSSWANALELAAVSDLMRRREQQETAGDLYAAEHVDAEIAALLRLTGRRAGHVLDLAIALRRLPLTARALEAGVIDLPRVEVIVDETTGLDDDHVAAVEQHILVRAPEQTTSEVRAATRRAVFTADPRAVRKRQEQAQREARVERWNEHAGTAALAGRDLSPTAVIAADQHISALARGLKAAGLTGTADQLRARAFLALLSGMPVSSLLPTSQQQPGSAVSSSDTSADPGQPSPPGMARNPGMAESSVTGGGPGAAAPGTPATADWPNLPASTGSPDTPTGDGSADTPTSAGSADAPTSADCPGLPANAERPGLPANAERPGLPANAERPGLPANADWPGVPAVAGTVNLTMPLTTWLGFGDAPGEVAGFGPLTADDSRHLGAAMAGHPQTRWCVTLTGDADRPVAHGCVLPGHGPPPPARGPAPSARGPAQPAHACESPVHGPAPPDHGPGPPAWLANIVMKWFESAGCAHQRQSTAYRPPAALQHMIRVRQQTCAFPGCRRPAGQCDLDHTTPFQRGGLTCECNLAPLCRRHHEAKQAPGWRLEQPEPGVLIWHAPSGRTYTTTPTRYAG